MTSDIVGVHGMAKHQSGRRQLLRDWEAALGDGLEAALGRRPARHPSLDIAFYGSIYLDQPQDTPITMSRPTDQDPLEGLQPGEVTEIYESAAEVFGSAELTAAAEQTDMGFNAIPGPLAAVLRTFDRRFGRAGAILHVGVLRQVRRYLVEASTHGRIDAIVVETAAQCRVLLAHSLGSVVAYRYLQQQSGHGVQLFVTLGSPLGLRMIRERLQVGSLDVPRWVNIRDPHDPVTCAGDLRRWWPQAEHHETHNGTDAHAVERYLGKRITGAAILSQFPEVMGG